MNNTEKQLKTLADAQASLATAQSSLNTCEAEDAPAAHNALVVAQARVRKAEQQLEQARIQAAAEAEEERQAEIRRCTPLASHEHFVHAVQPLMNRILSLRAQLIKVLGEVDAVLVEQNRAAEVCGASRMTANHALAHVVTAITRSDKGHLPVNATWLQPTNRAELHHAVAGLYGFNPHRLPQMDRDEIVDAVLAGVDPGKIVDDSERVLVESARQYADQKQQQLEDHNAQEKKKLEDQGLGGWFHPSAWFEPVTKLFTPRERVLADRPELAKETHV